MDQKLRAPKRTSKRATIVNRPRVSRGSRSDATADRHAFERVETVRVVRSFTPIAKPEAPDDVARAVADLAPTERLAVLLSSTTQAAADADHPDLARVLWALELAHQDGDLSWIKGKGCAALQADEYLRKRFGEGSYAHATYAQRNTTLSHVVRDPVLREREPSGGGRPALEDVGKAVDVIGIRLRLVGAELVIGAHRGSWPAARARMIAECEKVAERDDTQLRQPKNYLTAMLRGWGLTTAQARNAMRWVTRV